MTTTGVQYSEKPAEALGAMLGGAFLEPNLESLDVLPLTRQRVLESFPMGEVRRAGDGTAILKLGSRYLGGPLEHDDLSTRLRGCDEQCVVIVFGLGTGNLPRAVRAYCTSPIIVYEPDAGVLRRTLEYGPLDLGGIPLVCNLRDLSKAWHDSGKQQQLALVLPSPGYASEYPEALRAVSDTTRALVQRATITKNTYRQRARNWVQDIIDNVELLQQASPFLALADRFRKVPAFIIGAGPSLDRNIEGLREASAKGIVFATNSSAAALAARGIEPQVLICIESIDVSAKISKLPFIDRVVRAFSLSAAPGTLRTGRGPLLTIHEAVPQYSGPLKDLTGVPGVPACGSVSTAAMSLAFRLGCSPIVLVGQDLAYSEGRAYANGTGYETSRAEVNQERGLIELKWNSALLDAHGGSQGKRHEVEPLEWLESWGGQGRVASGPSFTAIQSWFESNAALLKESGQPVRLINATEGGVRLSGFEELRLAEVLAELPLAPITSAELAEQARAVCPPLAAAHIRQWLELQRQRTRSARGAARRLRRFADHACKMTGGADPQLITRAYARLQQAELDVRRAVVQCPLVDAWSHNPILEALSLLERTNEEGTIGAQQLAKESTQKSAHVARAIEEAARELEAALAAAAAKLGHPVANSQGDRACR